MVVTVAIQIQILDGLFVWSAGATRLAFTLIIQNQGWPLLHPAKQKAISLLQIPF